MVSSTVLDRWADSTAFCVEVMTDDSGRSMLCLVDGDGDQLFEEDDFDAVKEHVLRWPRERESRQPYVICLDMRTLRDLGMNLDWPDRMPITDLTLAFGGVPAVRAAMDDLVHDLDCREREWKAHVRACRAADIDMSSRSLLYELVPRRVTGALMRARGAAHMRAWRNVPRVKGRLLYDYQRLHEAAVRLYKVELHGVAVDVERAKEHIRVGVTRAQLSPLRSIVESSRDGMVYTKFDIVGGKTGRYKTAGGFNFMSLPKGAPRECVVSRYEGGEIVVVDFNAIDYRCIVQSIDDPGFKEKYEGCEDFHERTASFLFGLGNVTQLRRDIIKKMTYVYLYGGSEQTLADGTGLSIPKVREVLARLDKHLGPVAMFREQMAEWTTLTGSVKLPDGSFVTVAKDDHPGKVLGLYAQTYSSRIFDKSLVAAFDALRETRNKILFTVHDELVVDQHPDEIDGIVSMVDAMRTAAGPAFALKVKRGKNYEQAY